MEPNLKKPKLETNVVRRSPRLINKSTAALPPNLNQNKQAFYVNFGNVILDNQLYVKFLITKNVKVTKQFFTKVLNIKFTSEADTYEVVLEELRNFFKTKYEVDDESLSPANPTVNTYLPSTDHESSGAVAPRRRIELPPNNPLPEHGRTYIQEQKKYQDELFTRIDLICTTDKICNIMVNCADLTTVLRNKFSEKLLNYNWYNHTSFDQFDDEITILGNTILFDMDDNEITENDKLTLFKLIEKYQCKISILNALPIKNVRNYRVIDILAVREEITPNIEAKDDYLFETDDQYHFDILYNINIILPTTEIEMKYISELCSAESVKFKIFNTLLSTEKDSLYNFILKLYRHNLINWSSIGKISFASNSIKKKYIDHMYSLQNPTEFDLYINCVSAVKNFVQMNEVDIEKLSFDFLRATNAYILYLMDIKMITNEAILKAELYRIFRNITKNLKSL